MARRFAWTLALALTLTLVSCTKRMTESALEKETAPVVNTAAKTTTTTTSKPEAAAAFVPEATVRLRDGTTLALVDLTLIEKRSYEPSGMYTIRDSTQNIDVPVNVDGSWWLELPMTDIESIVLKPIRPDRYTWDWFEASMTTRAGETVHGRVPVEVDSSWYLGRHFVVKGRSVVLGSEGAFEMPFRELRKMASKGADSWILTSEKGEEHEVREPTLAKFWSAPLARGDCKLGDNLDITVNRTTVSVPVRNIRRLELTRRQFDRPSVRVSTHAGDEADGTLVEDFEYLFGRTEDGRVWFDLLSRADRIEFPPPPKD